MPYRIITLTLFLLAIATSVPAQAQHGPAPLCFPETGYCLEGPFIRYWQTHGGLMIFGYPITAMQPEQSRDTDRAPMTQWFERARFEYHPDNPPPYDVLLGRLGDDRLRQLGIDWQTLPRESGPRPGCLWFPETGHNVCDQERGRGFKTFWQTHGLVAPALSAYQRSLALFGFPLTEARIETNSRGEAILTQWFERARFEWHPNNPAQYRVLLGHLGREVAAGSRSDDLQNAVVRAITTLRGAAPRHGALTNVIAVDRQRQWAFGTITLLTPPGAEELPEGFLWLARKAGTDWDVALESTPRFLEWAAMAPADVLNPETRDLILSRGGQ